MRIYCVAFFGHRYVDNFIKVENLLEEQIRKLIDKNEYVLYLEDMTRIVVTHALDENLLRRYDRVLTLKNGSITESGSFDELMAKKGYLYSLFTVSQ